MKRAFSLVELSIVLIIMGLLVAGVSGGSKLIDRAKLSSLLNEIEEYKTAIYTFKLTYDALPGDMSDAISFWGTSGNLNNGNGDGQVHWDDGEVWDANLHLQRAGLILDQDLTGDLTKYTTDLKFSNGGGIRLIYAAPSYPQWHGNKSNVIQFGSGIDADNALLIPQDAYYIDKKIDDALPKDGKMRIVSWDATIDATCTNTSTNYYLSSDTIGCAMTIDFDL